MFIVVATIFKSRTMENYVFPTKLKVIIIFFAIFAEDY